METTVSEYPEHDKLKAVADKSQAIGEFLDWLMNERCVVMASWHHHDEHCVCRDEWHEKDSWSSGELCPECGSAWPHRRHHACGHSEAHPSPSHVSIRDWLALYFEIDTDALEREKRAMLEQLRETP